MATTNQKLEQGARSREALLEAAIELIAEGGYNATGVDAIARSAGVVKSALYWHFGSKDGLLVAALERTAIDWVKEIESNVVADNDPDGRLERLIDRVRDLFLQRPERIRLLLSALIERGATNDEVRLGVARILDAIRGVIAQRVQETLPMIPKHRAGGVATLVVETLAGAFIDTFADPDLDRFDLRLKLIRKMVVLVIGEELRAAQLGTAARGSSASPD